MTSNAKTESDDAIIKMYKDVPSSCLYEAHTGEARQPHGCIFRIQP